MVKYKCTIKTRKDEINMLSYYFESVGGKNIVADITVELEGGEIVVSKDGKKERTVVLKMLNSKEFQYFNDILNHLLNGAVGKSVYVSQKAEQAIREQALSSRKVHGYAPAMSIKEQGTPSRTT